MILFSAILGAPMLLVLAYHAGEWQLGVDLMSIGQTAPVLRVVGAGLLGTLVMHAVVLCIIMSEPLTTSAIGSVANLVTTIVGVTRFPDFIQKKLDLYPRDRHHVVALGLLGLSSAIWGVAQVRHHMIATTHVSRARVSMA